MYTPHHYIDDLNNAKDAENNNDITF